MNPILVAVKRPAGMISIHGRLATAQHTSLHLLTQLDPVCLYDIVMQVDHLGQEKYNATTPERCQRG